MHFFYALPRMVRNLDTPYHERTSYLTLAMTYIQNTYFLNESIQINPLISIKDVSFHVSFHVKFRYMGCCDFSIDNPENIFLVK